VVKKLSRLGVLIRENSWNSRQNVFSVFHPWSIRGQKMLSGLMAACRVDIVVLSWLDSVIRLPRVSDGNGGSSLAWNRT
jgi:hypothetical protein